MVRNQQHKDFVSIGFDYRCSIEYVRRYFSNQFIKGINLIKVNRIKEEHKHFQHFRYNTLIHLFAKLFSFVSVNSQVFDNHVDIQIFIFVVKLNGNLIHAIY